jgi:hypothetical protein
MLHRGAAADARFFPDLVACRKTLSTCHSEERSSPFASRPCRDDLEHLSSRPANKERFPAKTSGARITRLAAIENDNLKNKGGRSRSLAALPSRVRVNGMTAIPTRRTHPQLPFDSAQGKGRMGHHARKKSHSLSE